MSRVDVGGEHLDGPALAMADEEEAVIEAAIRLVEAWRDADDADQAHYRAQALTNIGERFAAQSRLANAKGEVTAAAVELLNAVTALEQAGGT